MTKMALAGSQLWGKQGGGAVLDLVREPVRPSGVWRSSGEARNLLRCPGGGLWAQQLAFHGESRYPALLNYSTAASQL